MRGFTFQVGQRITRIAIALLCGSRGLKMLHDMGSFRRYISIDYSGIHTLTLGLQLYWIN